MSDVTEIENPEKVIMEDHTKPYPYGVSGNYMKPDFAVLDELFPNQYKVHKFAVWFRTKEDAVIYLLSNKTTE